MYESYFGLTGPPFRLVPDPSFLFVGKGHREALTALRTGLAAGARVMVLSGEVGAGKTTLLQALLANVDPATTLTVQVSAANLDSETLAERLSEALGLPLQPDAHVRREALLSALASVPRTTFLVIDEAQHLAPSALDLLETLAYADALAPVRLQICLVGQPELRILLNAAQRSGFRDLIGVDRHLGPLEQAEIRLYVEHRLHRAGWTGRPEFEDAAFTEIFIFTAGNPRRINLLCSSLLLCACLKKQQRVDSPAVTWAAAAMREDAFHGAPDLLDLGSHFEHRPTLTEAFEAEAPEPGAATGRDDPPPTSSPNRVSVDAPDATRELSSDIAPPGLDLDAGSPAMNVRVLTDTAPPPLTVEHVDAPTTALVTDETAPTSNGDGRSDEVAPVSASPLDRELRSGVTAARRRQAILVSAASVGLALALLAYFVYQQNSHVGGSQTEVRKSAGNSMTAPVSPKTALDTARRSAGSVATDSSFQASAPSPLPSFTSPARPTDATATNASQDSRSARDSAAGPVSSGENAAPEGAMPAGSGAAPSPTPPCSGPALALGLCDADPSTRRRQ